MKSIGIATDSHGGISQSEAKKLGIIVIGLCGGKASKMDNICDYIIKVPSEKTPIIQESQIMIAHIICALVEG